MRPYLRAANVGWSGLRLDDVNHMNFTDAELDTYRLQPGDLLLSEASGSPGEVGKPALWSGEIVDCAFQNTLLRVRAREHEPEFLLHYFRYVALSGRFVPEARGVGINHLGRARLAGWMTPMPERHEQRRIVEILEEHLSRLDAAHSSLTLAHARQAAWMKATLQPLVWDESFPLTTVAEILREPMRNGRSDRSSEEPSAVRTLTLTAVTQGDFSERNTKRTTTTHDVAAGLWLEPGDVFVQRSNTPELVGTSARYDGPREWAIFPDLLIRLRPDEGLMDSRFLVAALQSERAHRTMRARAKGLAGSMPKIDQQAVGDTVLPLPSMERQREIIGQLAQRRSESNRLKSSLDTATRRGQALGRAVLAAAFAGKLTGRRMDVEVIEELAQQ